MARGANILIPGDPNAQKASPDQLPQKGIRAEILPILEDLEDLYKKYRGRPEGLAILVAEGVVYDHRIQTSCAGCVHLPSGANIHSARQWGRCLRCRRCEYLPDLWEGRTEARKKRGTVTWRDYRDPPNERMAEEKLEKIRKAAERRRKDYWYAEEE